MTKPTCETCRFWLSEKELDDPDRLKNLGMCRRHAPRPIENERNWNWPSIFGSDWCGEHQPKQGTVTTRQVTHEEHLPTAEEVRGIMRDDWQPKQEGEG